MALAEKSFALFSLNLQAVCFQQVAIWHENAAFRAERQSKLLNLNGLTAKHANSPNGQRRIAMPKNLEQTNDFYELVDMLDFSEVKIGQSQDKTTGAPKTRSDGAPKLYASLPIVSDRDPQRNVITLADGKKYRYSHGAIQINLHNLAPVDWAPDATTPGKQAASISLDQLQNLFRRK